jgi:hypothetical protein
MRATLDEIGLKYRTDKSSLHHNYLSFYESFMAPLRDAPITLLEIGVYQGASLKTWREYFTQAKIIGVDIQPSCKQFESDRVKIELADQSNLEHLAKLAATYGPFDLIIEDGSHMWEHQITSLRALFPFLRNGGHYVAEDLQTNYGVLQAKYRGVASQSCTEFLKRWMDVFVADDLIELESLEDPFLRTYGRAIEFMTFHRRACVVRKRVSATDWRVSLGPPLAPRPEDGPRVVINAHIGMRGDIFGPSGYVDEGADTYTIQGLALESEAHGLEYRVRFPDGAWSEWVGEGVFAGTRGQSLPITGFSARFTASLRQQFDVQTRGLFVGGVAIDARGGADCVAPSGAQMRGLQVTILPVPPFTLEAEKPAGEVEA